MNSEFILLTVSYLEPSKRINVLKDFIHVDMVISVCFWVVACRAGLEIPEAVDHGAHPQFSSGAICEEMRAQHS